MASCPPQLKHFSGGAENRKTNQLMIVPQFAHLKKSSIVPPFIPCFNPQNLTN